MAQLFFIIDLLDHLTLCMLYLNSEKERKMPKALGKRIRRVSEFYLLTISINCTYHGV